MIRTRDVFVLVHGALVLCLASVLLACNSPTCPVPNIPLVREQTVGVTKGFPTLADVAPEGSPALSMKGTIAEFAFVPRNDEEFTKVFGRPPSQGEWQSIQNALATNTKRPGPSPVTILDEREFARVLASLDENVVVVIGHNENGILKTGVGQLPLVSMQGACAKTGKVCIFLSCKSGGFVSDKGGIGVQSELTYAEAFTFLDAIGQRVRSSTAKAQTIETLKRLIVEDIATLENQAARDAAVRYVVVGGAVVGLSVTVVVAADVSGG